MPFSLSLLHNQPLKGRSNQLVAGDNECPSGRSEALPWATVAQLEPGGGLVIPPAVLKTQAVPWQWLMNSFTGLSAMHCMIILHMCGSVTPNENPPTMWSLDFVTTIVSLLMCFAYPNSLSWPGVVFTLHVVRFWDVPVALKHQALVLCHQLTTINHDLTD